MNEHIENLPEELQGTVINQIKELVVFRRYAEKIRDSLRDLEKEYPKYSDRFNYSGDAMQKITVNLGDMMQKVTSSLKETANDLREIEPN